MPESLPRDGPLRAAALLVVVMALAALSRLYESATRKEAGFSSLAAARFIETDGQSDRELKKEKGSSLLREGKVDLNTADRETLMALPGIGPAMAERILADRSERGPYGAPDELIRVKGIGVKTLERLLPYLSGASAEPKNAPLETIQ